MALKKAPLGLLSQKKHGNIFNGLSKMQAGRRIEMRKPYIEIRKDEYDTFTLFCFIFPTSESPMEDRRITIEKNDFRTMVELAKLLK